MSECIEYTVSVADVNKATGCEMCHDEWVYDNLGEARADFMELCRDECGERGTMRRRTLYRSRAETVVDLCKEVDGETEVLESEVFALA